MIWASKELFFLSNKINQTKYSPQKYIYFLDLRYFHWLGPLDWVSHRVAMSMYVFMYPLKGYFFRPLIGPHITWSVQGLSLAPTSSPLPDNYTKWDSLTEIANSKQNRPQADSVKIQYTEDHKISWSVHLVSPNQI